MSIRWGMIGCGAVTEVKSGPGFQNARDSALVAVMRRDGRRAEEYARRHGVPRWYDDADRLIADGQVDAVYIATPPGAHLEHALRVAGVGKPAYVEKPMARNHAECLRMVEAFAAARLPLFVAYYRRALPRFVKARELIDAGRLGRITGVTSLSAGPVPAPDGRVRTGWHLRAEQSGGGLFIDSGCHTLDILDFLLGPLAEVRGQAANLAGISDVEDAVAMTFRIGGAPGAAQWNYASAVREDLLQITGTQGRLVLSTFGEEPVRLVGPEGDIASFDLPHPPCVQQPLIQSVVDELLGRGRCPSTGDSAARTSAVMDLALADYYAGRADAFWTRPHTWPGRVTPGPAR